VGKDDVSMDVLVNPPPVSPAKKGGYPPYVLIGVVGDYKAKGEKEVISQNPPSRLSRDYNFLSILSSSSTFFSKVSMWSRIT